MDTLISFIGKQFGGYKDTCYQLNDQTFTTKFIGTDLAKIIKPKNYY